MRILLDTHILIWALSDLPRLREDARRDIADRRNVIFFSAASIWEIAIKAARRRADFDIDPLDIIDEATAVGFVELPVSARVAAAVRDLPAHHHDPFDRLLVAQALAEPCILLTADRTLQAYTELVRLV